MTSINEATVSLTAAEDESVSLTASETESVAVSVSTSIVTTGGTYYDGETEITPTDETQTLETAGYKLAANITINPIPSNYGLISWDGSSLSVS